MYGVIQALLLVTRITANALPVVGMILIIPLIKSDYVIAAVYGLIILTALAIHRNKEDQTLLIFGFFASLLAETLFISTGVETFERKTLLGLMPIWLPILWAYIFMAMRRAISALDAYLGSSG